MGIQVEFNPDLALRTFGAEGRLKSECLPEKLEVGKSYNFLKEGQRNYWLEGEIPLRITEGHQKLSRPIASIRILYAMHLMENNMLYTQGEYEVREVFDINDKSIHFEGMDKR